LRDPLHISSADTVASEEDRFHRFKLIGWWDQARLASAKVLVVGAGALGNEIIKNLALLGVGNVLIADLDRIENSNLSRSVLYRACDSGKPKAEVAARAARDIYPDIHAHFFHGDIVNDLGLGVYRWADVVIGGLDNREARLSINRNCWKVNKPWIDGAIEQIDGVARVFIPDGPCYECTMSNRDWDLIRHRRSCNLLSRAEMQGGKTPTTPTVSSIVAGVQTQEAVKLMHGLQTIGGRGWVFNGLSADVYQTEFQRKADCYSHDTLDDVISLDAKVDEVTVGEMLQLAADRLGQKVELELVREVLHKLVCSRCKAQALLFASPGSVKAGQESCPVCGAAREVVTFSKFRGEDDFLDRKLAEAGVPPFDIFIARTADRAVGFELSGDASRVLGPLAPSGGLELL
jgi:molybdopterin/thiamine biosynthesis adenylyltransferase